MANKSNNSGGLQLKKRPSADELRKAAKAPGKNPKPPKKGKIKTLANAESFRTKWNDWVDKIKDRIGEADKVEKDKKKLADAKKAISGL